MSTYQDISKEQMTNLYLYGKDTTPGDKVDESLIRPAGSGTDIAVDKKYFMTTGAGRFANASDFAIVKQFFQNKDIPPGRYTKAELAKMLGLETYGLSLHQGLYDDGKDDYVTRVYVWGSSSFKITDDAVFVVGEDGQRQIENFGIEPNGQENFDFVGGRLSEGANSFLEPNIDPSGIGRTVNITFSGDVDRTTFTLDDFHQSESTRIAPNILLGVNALKLPELVDELFAEGVTRYLDEKGRPILYGTAGGDELNLDRVKNGFLDSNLMMHRLLGFYAGNGVVGIGGAGDDHIKGWDTDDVIYGDEGNDQIDGGKGADEMYGGSGDDFYVVDNVNDKVVEKEGEGKDRVRANVDYTLSANVEELELIGDDDLQGTGNELDNKIDGNSGNNVLSGEGGDDEIWGDAGNDMLYGDDGSDKLWGGTGDDELFGGDGDDELYGEDGTDTLRGGAGRDKLDGGSGSDRMEGGDGYDIYQATSGDIILDSDGSGEVYLEGVGRLTGGVRKKNDAENVYRKGDLTYVLNGTTLTVQGGMTIEQFKNGDLGIFLKEEDDDNEENPDVNDAEHRTSPIIVDLDGDGVETSAYSRDRYFDHDANGMLESTAWTGADDGFLVRDLNGNGRIDSGREMFGNHTLLKNGQLAANGYLALQDLDDNQDGVLDASDAAYGQLRIWRDSNGNGRTDDGELLTLDQAGLKGIRTGWTPSSYVDANGQAHQQTGSAIRNDGTSAATADVWLQVDAGRRLNEQPVDGWRDVLGLPDAKAFGNLPDLRQAMASDTKLKGMVEAFVAEQNPQKRDAMVEGLIFQWAGVADVDPKSRDPRMVYGHVMDARQLLVLEQLIGRGYLGTWCWGERDPNPHGNAAPLLIAEFKQFQAYVGAQLTAQANAADYPFIQGGFASGYTHVQVDWNAFQQYAAGLHAQGKVDTLIGIYNVLRDLGMYSPVFRDQSKQAFDTLVASYPDLAPIFDTPSLLGTAGNDTLFGSDRGEVIVAGAGDDAIFGRGGDDSYYYRIGDGKDRIYDSAGNDKLIFMDGIAAADLTIRRDLTSIFIQVGSGASAGEVRIDNVFDENGHLREGAIESIQFHDGTQWDLAGILSRIDMPVTAGDDVLYGTVGNDVLAALDGNDQLMGLDGDDRLEGGAGADVLVGGNGNDVLVGGAGDDRLNGGAGNDDYVFAQGFGHDVIENYDDKVDRNDRIVFGAGISRADLTASRSGDDLLLTLASGDSILVRSHFAGSGGYSINQVVFVDGTVLDQAALGALVLGGTSGNDILKGYDTDDVIQGLAGDDAIYGNGGNDKLIGGAGNDYLSGGAGADQLDGGDGNDALYGDDGDDVLSGGAGDDYLEGGFGADQLVGGEGNDRLFGGAGNDQLAGGKGDDRLEGGYGDDNYYFTRGDGKDTILDIGGATTIYVSSLSLDDVYFRREGTSLVIRFTGAEGDEIRLESFFNAVSGLATGGLSMDNGSGRTWQLTADAINSEVLKAGEGDDVIMANALSNIINGLGGNDTIWANDGADVVDGGAGDDRIYGEQGNDTLIGGAGDDQLYGGAGDDSLDGGDGDDYLDGGDGVDRLIGGLGKDYLLGGAGNDDLQGGEGDDTLDGGEGADTMEGGKGDDIYIVDNAGDVVLELAGEGNDTIRSSVSYTLVDGVERLELVGSGQINAQGNALGNEIVGNDAANTLDGRDGDDLLQGGGGNDVLYGGSGHDVLDGGAGIDQMFGGTGDDDYIVDNEDDVVVEVAGEGVDTVYARSNYTLSANVENLVLTDGGWAYRATGNADNNTLTGNASNNYLDGRQGADRMIGGLGDDTYVVDQAGDVIIEMEGEGIDTVESSISYALGDTLENLTLTGTADISGIGNDKDNVLIGNDGNNRLEGGLGADTLVGGKGDDYYVEESSDDWVREYANEGIDTVERRYETILVLAGNVENLTLAAGIQTGNGNELDNVITGNAGDNKLAGLDGEDVLYGLDGNDSMWGGTGNDKLFGGAGNDYLDGEEGIDYLEGGAGNDVYIVDNSNDVVVEAVDGGTDQVQTTASYVLSDNIENLFLMGDTAIDGTGNALDNYMAGNEADNVMYGMGGNDTMVAGKGNDTLFGGTGDDKYVFDASSGSDVVDNTGGGYDGVFFTGGVTRDRLSFSRDGNDLLISIDGSATPSVRVANHFLGGDAAIDYVQPDGGYALTTTEINQIVAGGSSGGQYDRVVDGTAAGEQLVGSAGKDLIRGLGGDDTLFGMAGNDTLQGGDGNDYLAGGSGSGTGSGDDRLEGGAGNDQLNGEDGSNTLIGGAGDDKYVYGNGQDVIDNTGGGYDGIFFNNGITASQLTFSRDGDDLLIKVNGDAAKSVRVTGHFLGGDMAIDYVQPASGSLLNTAAINALAGGTSGGGGTTPGEPGNDADYTKTIAGTANGEQLVGTSGRDLIRGLGGNDTLFGMGGDDKLVGGDGDDYLSGGNGSFSGSGNDILVGGAGADTLVGEDGDDLLQGGTGDDKYVYRAGSGKDVIDNTGGGTDWLMFDGIDRTRLSFHRNGDDLIVLVDGSSSQQVRVQNHFKGGDLAISYVQPSDGYAIPASQFASLLKPLPSGFTPAGTASKMAMVASTNLNSTSSSELHQLVQAMSQLGGGASTVELPDSQGMDGYVPSLAVAPSWRSASSMMH